MPLLQSISAIFIFSIAFPANAAIFEHDRSLKTVIISDNSDKLQLIVDYSKGCKVSQVKINGKNTISGSGVYTSVKTKRAIYTSVESPAKVKVVNRKNRLSISNIVFGNDDITVSETWIFTIKDNNIFWEIRRQYRNSCNLEDMAMPVWNFENLSTWKGGILNTGGVIWCKYLKNTDDTYGVHTNGVTFWEPGSGDGFRIEASSGENMACTFSHSQSHEFRFTQYLTPFETGQRYNLSRFVHGKADVFSPFEVTTGQSAVSLKLSYVDYNKVYDRGTLAGIDAVAVRELLNTTGRYGVVDKNIIGGNGWLTNWKCLHEPFFAQIGLAVNDENYTGNLAATLDQERVLAVGKDGRVLARWHDVPEAENSNYNFKTGYYDCPWGYTIDAQPGQVINTVELFKQNGDIEWLKSHKVNCERILDWLIKRDSNNNGIFEMLNDNTGENKCSDWLDVVWASFENAFVNAQMYEALILWAECELLLGEKGKAVFYSRIASRLKEAFNKPVQYGGFWSPDKKQYIYWRDKDGTLHGDNLVTPVNFAAIAFGICDDPQRISEILGQIESKTSAENLFHWPLCFESFKQEEVYTPVNWPFPNYENGDIFPSWGYLGIRAYVKHDKSIALKYIEKLLEQYNRDGLSSQRFSRTTQEGIGSDILAGSATTITALYRDIYGIRPEWNRFGLEPNMLNDLNGTEFNYTLRDQIYNIRLSENNYQVKTNGFILKSNCGFGVNMDGNMLRFYPDNGENERLAITRKNLLPVDIEIVEWGSSIRIWEINSVGAYIFSVSGLDPGTSYRLGAGGTTIQSYISDASGNITFEFNCQVQTHFNISEY